MRRMIVLTMLVGLGFLVLKPIAQQAAQQPARPPAEPMRIEKVKDNLYFIRGPWNPAANDALLHEPGDVAIRVTPDGLIVIDDKFPQHTQDILDRIKTVSSLPIKYLINTHHHADHAGGDANFINLTEIIAHKNVRENMIRNKQAGAPRIVFNDELSVFLGGVEVKAIHLGRGHTNGDSVISFPDLRVIHAGDLLIDGMPYIDYDNGGTALEWPKTLDEISKLDFDVIIPGHGRLLTRADLLENKAAFEKMNAHMTDLVRRGVPKDQAMADLTAYLKQIGWDNTVSTATFLTRSLGPYYDELAAATRAR
jgi:glyoxylase-like metal-dependent hydrolase (beta-lactamase superfamily II)